MAVTVGLRPVDQSVPLVAPLDQANGASPNVTAKNSPNLEYPSEEAVTHILDVFHQVKKQASVILIIDTSGSMTGDKLKGAVDGAISFVDQMESEERVSVITFYDKITELSPLDRVGDVRESLKQKIAGVYAGGGTALHQVVMLALDKMAAIQAEDAAKGENRLYGIVLLTDGKNEVSGGPSEADLLSRLPSGDQPGGVKLFTISYGEDANKDLMKTLANRTNGKNFEGNPQNIRSVYLSISAEF